MTALELVTANRADLAARIASAFLHHASARGVASDSAELIFAWDQLRDSEWFAIWRSARASRCPSIATKRVARNLLLARLGLDEVLRLVGPGGSVEPEGYSISAEDRALMLESETASVLRSQDAAKEFGP